MIFCPSPQRKKAFAENVVNALTDEQKAKLGITDANKFLAVVAISRMSTPWLTEVSGDTRDEQEEEADKKIDNPEEYIPRLMAQAEVMLDEKNFEIAQDQYNKYLESTEGKGAGQYVFMQEDTLEGLDSENKKIGLEPRLVQYQDEYGKIMKVIERWQDPETKKYCAALVFMKPVKTEKIPPQEKVLQALNRLAVLSKEAWAVDDEVIEERTGRRGRLSEHLKGGDKTLPKKQWEPAEGWKKTGRKYWTYNGRTLIANSVSNEIHEFKEDDTQYVYQNLGNILDNFGRSFFDKKSRLWREFGNLKELASKKELSKEEKNSIQRFITEEMQDIYTVRGFLNLAKDFIRLEEQILSRWPEAKVFSGQVRLFGQNTKRKDFVLGIPDLFIIDKEGKLHVMDFKTRKINKNNYSTLDEEPGSDFNRRDDWQTQVSFYIRILQSLGFNVEEAPHVVQIDTYYESAKDFDVTKTSVSVKVGEESMSLAEYTETYGNIRNEGDWDIRQELTRLSSVDDTTKPRSILYIEPRLHLDYGESGMSEELKALRGEGELEFQDDLTFEEQYDSLDELLQDVLKDFMGPAIHRGLAQGPTRLPESDIDSRPELISTDEMQCVIEGIMYEVSDIIEGISKGTSRIMYKMRKAFPAKDIDSLKGKSHREIINTIGIDKIVENVFNERIGKAFKADFPILIREEYKRLADEDGSWEHEGYKFPNWKEYSRAKSRNDRAGWMKSHYNQLVMKGQRKLKALENVTCPVKLDNIALEQIAPDQTVDIDSNNLKEDNGDNDAITSFLEMMTEGANILEAWMMNQRNFSPKASLAKEIKRMFEDIILEEEDGGFVYDRYGWNIPQHLNATKAVQACLTICRNCESIEEMEDALKSAALIPSNRWINQVLERIDTKTDPSRKQMRAKFYCHMRKDALVYSVTEFKTVNGQRVAQTKIVNMKSAVQTMRQSLRATFFAGNVGMFDEGNGLNPVPIITRDPDTGKNILFKTGGVNIVQKISNEANILLEIYKRIDRNGYDTARAYDSEIGTFDDYIVKKLKENRVAERLTNLLNGIGVLVTQDIVENAAYYKPKQKTTGNLRILLDNITEVCKNLRNQEGEEGIPSGLRGNKANPFYTTILETLGDYVQEHIEDCVYQGGKTYYTYTNPSRIGHIVRNVKDALSQHDPNEEDRVSRFLYDNYGRFKGWYTDEKGNYLTDWLAQLTSYTGTTGSAARRAFMHKVELTFMGEKYADMGPLTFMRSLLHNYFGSLSDENEGKGRYRWFGLPTMSNKPTNEFIRMLRYDSHTDIINNVLMSTFKQEMNRIADVLWHYACNAVPTDNFDILDVEKEENGTYKDKLKELIREEVSAKEGKGIRDSLEKNNPGWGKKRLDAEVSKKIDSLAQKEIDEFKGYNVRKTTADGTPYVEHVKGRIENGEITLKDLKRLLKINSGAKFHFLWYLNDDILNNTEDFLDDAVNFNERIRRRLNLLLSPADSDAQINKDVTFEEDTNKSVRRLLEVNMEGLVDDDGEIIRKGIVDKELDHMREIGLLEKEEKRIMGHTVEIMKYQSEFGGKLGRIETEKVGKNYKTIQEAAEAAAQAFEKGLREYIWEDIAANINIIQLTGGDLAYFGNSVNYQKRNAMYHSPGLHLMHDPDYDDGFLRSVHISDELLKSDLEHNTRLALENYKDTLETDGQKEEYDMMINVIMSEIRKINTTDGQSFSCITSLRKKLALAGDWSPQDEEGYQKLLKGDLSMETLGTFINPKQPRKPFVASDVTKYSGSPSMTLRKTPLQDKNSEYLIVLADALMRGAGKRSKLAAISDFMERTAHEDFDLSKPTHTHGIDTVHFHSVGKVGVSGIIDINDFDKHYDDIYAKAVEDNSPEVKGEGGEVLSKDEAYNTLLTKFLLDTVAPKKENKEDSSVADVYNKKQKLSEPDVLGRQALKPEELYYDSDFVDTIPVEDYIVQQEVPAHLLDNEQLYGSQIRILGISDITPRTMFDVKGEKEPMRAKDLVDEYKRLHADNINSAFREFMKELNLDKLAEYTDPSGRAIPLDLCPQHIKDAVYKKLAAILQKELVTDGKYSTDLQKACSLVTNALGIQGFRIPPIDPIHSGRIQMLLNSIIKTRINKETVNGGPVVQTTAYDNRLHIRFKSKEGGLLKTFDEYVKEDSDLKDLDMKKDDDRELAIRMYREYIKDEQGGIAYYECYMPIPDPALERLMVNPDGSMMSFEEIKSKFRDPEDPENDKRLKAIWDSMTELIGYRIPTEDKYSMIPMKIVGFVPKAAGEVVMLPQEITFLTGSDFDIDKLYIMKKTFDVATIEQSEEDESKITVTIGNRTKTIDIDNFIASFKAMQNGEAFQKATSKCVSNLDRILSGDYSRDIMTGLSEEEKKAVTTDLTALIGNKRTFVNWLRDQVIQMAFEEFSDKKSDLPKQAKAARNNRLLDLQWAVLTNEDTVPKMLNPGNFDPQKKVGRMIRILKEGTEKDRTLENWKELYKKSSGALGSMLEKGDSHNVTLSSSKIYFQRQNMQGTQMVGIFANNNVSHAFLSFQKIGINLYNGKANKSFYFDGELIGDPNNPTVLDRLRGFNGQLISKTIASFLAASVDTAKDPTLADMNVNTFTGGVAMALVRMGFDTQQVALFLSQPIIMELTSLFFKNKSSQEFYTGYNAVEELLSRMGLKKEDLYVTDDIKNAGTLTMENLIEHIADSGFMDKTGFDKNARQYQLSVLKAFYTLLDVSRDMQDLTFCTKFNSVTNAVGPTIADTEMDVQKVTKFLQNAANKKTVFHVPPKGEENKTDGYTNPTAVISSDPILEAFYESTLGDNGAAKSLFKHLFLHYSDSFKNVMDFFLEHYTKNGKIDAKLYNKLISDYMYYCLTYRSNDDKIQPVLPYDNEIREEEEGDMDYLVKGMVSRYRDIQNMEKRRSVPNMILDQHLGSNCLRIREPDEYLTIPILEFNGSQINSENEDEVRRAWDGLLQMDDPALTQEENQNIQRFGVDLFFYSLMRNGFTFSPKTMMHLATTIARLSARFGNTFDNYVHGIYRLPFISEVLTGQALAGSGNDYGHLSRFCDQFVRNNSSNKRLVPFVEADSSLVDADSSTDGRLVLRVKSDEKYKLNPYMLDSKNPMKFVNFVSRDGKEMHYDLYVADDDDGYSKAMREGSEYVIISYKKTSRLGISHNFIEYNANSDGAVTGSYFDDIRGVSDAAFEEDEEVRDGEETQESNSVQEDSDLVFEDIKAQFYSAVAKAKGKEGMAVQEIFSKTERKFRAALIGVLQYNLTAKKDAEHYFMDEFNTLLEQDAEKATKEDKEGAWKTLEENREEIEKIFKELNACGLV